MSCTVQADHAAVLGHIIGIAHTFRTAGLADNSAQSGCISGIDRFPGLGFCTNL